MQKRSPNSVDVHVGSRVRRLRVAWRMSQQELGRRLGVTFQQVQKYEKGLNRIGSSRLYAISRVFGVPVQVFFEGIPDLETSSAEGASGDESVPRVADVAWSAEEIRLGRAFGRIPDRAVRKRVFELIMALAEPDD